MKKSSRHFLGFAKYNRLLTRDGLLVLAILFAATNIVILAQPRTARADDGNTYVTCGFEVTPTGCGNPPGGGTQEDPYQISTCNDLQDMLNDKAAYYELLNNIDCGDTVNWNEGAGFIPIGTCWGGEFSGKLYGNKHIISNLYINRPSVDQQSLIGCTSNGAVVDKLGMANVNITGQRYTAGIVSTLTGSDSSISNSYVTGMINNPKNDETVGSGQFAGGIVSGMTGGAHIYNSYSVADIYTFYSDMWGEGGISGFAYDESAALNSFWSTETEHTILLSEGGGTGKTDVEMKTGSTFTDAGWDFEDTWAINASVNSGYPYLQGSLTAPSAGAQIISPDGDDSKAILIEQLEGTEICTAFEDDTYTRHETDLDDQDTAYDYVSAMVGFTLSGCEVGGTTTMRLVFTGTFDPAAVTLRKYDATTHQYETVQTLTKTVTTLNNLPALEVTYQITDGGTLDQDGTANGVIVDPVGLGAVSASNTTTLAASGQSASTFMIMASALMILGLIPVTQAMSNSKQ